MTYWRFGRLNKRGNNVDTKHKHYNLCFHAYRNISHNPERRAENMCLHFDEATAQIEAMGGSPAKHERLFMAWMRALGRCASSMIVGPANFPVARMKKAFIVELKRSEEYWGYLDTVKERHEKKEFYAANPHARPISSDDPDALLKLRSKLETMEAQHAAMISANKLNRGTHQRFEIANSNARMKAVRERIAGLETAKARTHVEVHREGYKVIQNVEANRVQIVFEEKPDFATCDRLKRLGFKWAPTRNAWQRQLTNAGVYAAKKFMNTPTNESHGDAR